MDDALSRRLAGKSEPSDEPKDESSGMNNLGAQMVGGLAGLSALHASGWDPPADLEWRDDQEEWHVSPTVEQETSIPRSKARTMAMVAGFFLLALATRAVFLYLVTDPDLMIPSWSNDTWHRWQIAFLSKEVGFAQESARLWDLKGLEYFWGILHPLLISTLFAITKSVDVMLMRWLTIVAGAANIVLLYLLGRRFWNKNVGIAAAIFALLNPIVIFNDPSGMIEPISFALLLWGIYLYPKRALFAGLLLALAATTRAEAWLMSFGILFAAMIGRSRTDQKIALALGWIIPVGLYMKHLLDSTGNAIYPIYWNFLANAAGRWQFREELTSYQLAVRPVLGAIFIICCIAAVWMLWKRPRGYLLLLLGIGATAFITGFIGLTAYLNSYETWFWLTRFFVFSYIFGGLLLAIFIHSWLPRRFEWGQRSDVTWMLTVGVLVALQLTWPAVMFDVKEGYTGRTVSSDLQDQGAYIKDLYRGGTVMIPETNPQFTYAIARYGDIAGENIQGQQYGPIYYYEGDDPFADWETVGRQMSEWLQKEDVTLLVINPGDERFTRMFEDKPRSYSYVGVVPHNSLEVYKVRQP